MIVRTWLITDCSHNHNQLHQSITVEDNQAPVLHGLPVYVVAPCDAIPPKADVTITDDCDEDPKLVYKTESISGSCKTQYKELRTWSGADECGNLVVYTQTIVTFDDHAPTFSGVPLDTTLDCLYPYDGEVPGVEDVCDPYVTVHSNEVKKDGTCEYDGVVYRSWNANDACGNSVVAEQTITLQDITPPSWTETPKPLITAEYPTEPEPPVPVASDNCEYAPDIQFNERKLQFGYICPKAYRLVRAWFVTDVCGNMGPPIYQHVVIDDTRAPVFLSTPSDITVECDDIPPPYPVHAVDHYEDIVVTLKEETKFGTCNNDYDIYRTWTAADSCGNSNTTVQIITVQDTEKPRFYTLPNDDTAECVTPAPALVTAEDNCDGYIDVSLIDEHSEEGGTYASGEPMRTVYRHWRVADNCGNSNDAFHTIEVYDTKDPYFLEYAAGVIAECDSIPPIPVVVSHDECDPNPVSWFELFDDNPGTCENAETIYRKWTVTDSVGHISVFEQTVTVVDTTPPELQGYPIDTIDVECDAIPPHGSMQATDNCDYDVLVTFDERKINIEYKCKDEHVLFWTWSAHDDCGNTASYTKTVNVYDTVMPEIWCNGTYCGEYEDVDVECDDDFLNWPLHVTCTDNCAENCTIRDQHTTNHGTCEDAYLKIDQWTVRDECGNEASYVRTITVVDSTPPVWTKTPNQTRSVPYDGNVNCPTTDDLIADDNCDDQVAVTCEAEVVAGVCPQDYTKTCTCKAVDNCGNSVQFVQIINVFDDEPPVIPDIPDTTYECLQTVQQPSEPYVNWGYNTGVVSVVQRTLPINCTYQLIFTWTAIDECNLHGVSFQTIHVIDETAPVIHNVPQDETVECHPGSPPGYLNADDNCDGKVLVLFDTEKINVEGPYCYTLVRTWSATDHCGHLTVETQTVVVDDNEAPVVSYPPGNLTTDCHSVPFALNEDVVANDNCESHRNVTFTDDKVPGSCDCDFKRLRKWVVCDSCENCVTVESTVTVVDDTPPVLSEYCVDVTVQTGDVPYPPDVSGSDTYGVDTEVTYTQTRVNSSYAVDSPWLYKLIRHWVTEDDCKNEISHSCTVTVIDTIPVPVNGVPKDVVLPCPPDGTFPNEYLTSTITVAVTNAITEADIDVTVSVDDTNAGTCESEYVWIRCWQTTDHSSNTDEACFTITVVDTEPPYFTTYPNVEFAECEPQGVQDGDVEAEDNCPAGVSVVLDEEDFTGGAYSGFFVRTWTATDACGHTSLHSQTVWVADTEPPTWTNPPEDLTVYCDEVPPVVNLTASDKCHPETDIMFLTWKEVVCEGEYVIYNNWRANDAEGNWISWEQRIEVYDRKSPVLYAGLFSTYNANDSVLIADSPLHEFLTQECPWEEIHHPVYAKDDCIEYAWDVPLYGIDRWGDYCGAYVAFTWQTADDCGNEVDFAQTVVIQDTTPPTLTGCPGQNISLHCHEPIPRPYIGANDDCDVGVTPIRTETIIPGSCDYEYQVHVVWSVEDHCGFTDECDQYVTFRDDENPVITLHGPGNMTQPCDSSYDVPAVSADDDCQDYFDIDYQLEQVDGTCPCEYALHRVWSTTDKCGKQDSVTQTVTVEDNEAPKLSGCPKDVTVPCLHEPPVAPVTATDNCCDVTLEYNQQREDSECLLTYKLFRSWTATDDCGHESKCEQTVSVVDTEGPTFTLGSVIPKFRKVECDEIPTQAQLTAFDECEGEIPVEPTDVTHSGDCQDNFYVLRSWDAHDDCGNSIHLEATVQVVDTTPPVIELPVAESYECDYIPNEDNHNVVATDNCDPNPSVTFTANILGV
eukprot:TRINITY_DN8_c1_g1_i3.p1 TRINITY_DN8_c1_g1~~TRINITY_DN8_c1_g1_i3.p1  ORF type:complete len:1791 (+),score=620.90 TRINITY_DN8_c1_g1_i3:1727-7099(+)